MNYEKTFIALIASQKAPWQFLQNALLAVKKDGSAGGLRKKAAETKSPENLSTKWHLSMDKCHLKSFLAEFFRFITFQHPMVLPQGLRVPRTQGQRPVVRKGLYENGEYLKFISSRK